MDGALELLEDARLTPALQAQLWQTGALDGNPGDEPGAAAFKALPAANAVVQVRGRDRRLLDSRVLERPLATLEATHLYGSARVTYSVTVDYSVGFGSYAGPMTTFAEVMGGTLHWLSTGNKGSGQVHEITVMTSLKTTWKLVPAAHGGRDILEAACRPGPNILQNGDDFTITYRRYTFAYGAWVELARTKPGFAEFDDGFPARTLFP